ncbi:MAG: FAD:protein FMN transferase [Anaeroplasma sp.]
MKKLLISLYFLLCIFLTSCSTALVVQSTAPIIVMDTFVSITFYNVDNYEEYYQGVKKIYNDVNRVCSDYESNYLNNSIYDLNVKRCIEADELLIDIIETALTICEETNGYYNPFVGRLTHLWKDAINMNQILDSKIIDEELTIINSTSISIENNKVSLIGEGNLDLGGIAKGYATELAKKYLDSNKVTSYILDAGNSNIVAGTKNGRNFIIGLTDPITRNTFAKLKGTNLTIGTSSIQYQRMQINDYYYHHLINPHSGMPENKYDSISVLCDNSIIADAYATAFFSMDLDDIKRIIEKQDIDVIILKNSEIIFQTLGDEYYA